MSDAIDAQAVENLAFRAEGTNRSLKQKVVFTGNFLNFAGNESIRGAGVAGAGSLVSTDSMGRPKAPVQGVTASATSPPTQLTLQNANTPQTASRAVNQQLQIPPNEKIEGNVSVGGTNVKIEAEYATQSKLFNRRAAILAAAVFELSVHLRLPQRSSEGLTATPNRESVRLGQERRATKLKAAAARMAARRYGILTANVTAIRSPKGRSFQCRRSASSFLRRTSRIRKDLFDDHAQTLIRVAAVRHPVHCPEPWDSQGRDGPRLPCSQNCSAWGVARAFQCAATVHGKLERARAAVLQFGVFLKNGCPG